MDPMGILVKEFLELQTNSSSFEQQKSKVKSLLVGGFNFNPSEKYESNWIMKPQFRDEN